MSRTLLAICIALASLCMGRLGMSAPSVSFEKIADSNTVVPGYPKYTYPGVFPGQGMNFESGTLLWGSSFVQFPFDPDVFWGVTAYRDGEFELIADSNNSIFGKVSAHQFGMDGSDIDGDRLLIGATDTFTGRSGLYTVKDDGIVEVASSDSVVIPGTSGQFTNIRPGRFVGDSIAFQGRRPDGQSGIYGVPADGSGQTFTIIDQSTPFPTFDAMGITAAGFTPGESSGDRFAFRSESEFGLTLGLYTSDTQGNVATIAELEQPMPGGVGRYRDLGRGTILPSMDGDRVAFAASDQDSDLERIFMADAITGETTVLLDNTQLPTKQPYPGVFMPSISGENVAFLAGFLNGQALLVHMDGVTHVILEAGDTLDGKVVNSIEISPFSFDGDQIAFAPFFEDGTSALYIATVPGPGVAPLLWVGVLVLSRRRRR